MSDNNRTSNTYGGITFFQGLFLVFLVLKLLGHIDWSWWWVTAPLWAPLAVLLVVLVGVLLVWAVFRTLRWWRESKARREEYWNGYYDETDVR